MKKELYEKIAERGQLVVITGPEGSGKKELIERYLNEHKSACTVVSATTREPKEGEEDGKDYYFLSFIEFERMIRTGQMLEYSYVDRMAYGTPKKAVEDARAAGRNVILDIDAVGAMKVKTLCPDATLIFILPQSWEDLEQTLIKAGNYDEDKVAELLELAAEEISCANLYDYIIVLDDMDKAVRRVAQIVHGHRYHRNSMKEFIDSYMEMEVKPNTESVSDVLGA